MILDNEISVNITARNITHFRNLKYSCKIGDLLIVKTNELTYGNKTMINVKCDNSECNKMKKMTFKDYNIFTKKCLKIIIVNLVKI